MRVSVAAESNVRTYGFMRRRHLPLFSCRAIDPPESYASPHALHMTSAQSLHLHLPSISLPSPFYLPSISLLSPFYLPSISLLSARYTPGAQRVKRRLRRAHDGESEQRGG